MFSPASSITSACISVFYWLFGMNSDDEISVSDLNEYFIGVVAFINNNDNHYHNLRC